MRSEYLSLNASSAVVKAASIMRSVDPKIHIYARMSEAALAPVFDVDELEANLLGREPVREFDGTPIGKTVYWLDIMDGIPPLAYIRGVHFSKDGTELGESDVFELKELKDE